MPRDSLRDGGGSFWEEGSDDRCHEVRLGQSNMGRPPGPAVRSGAVPWKSQRGEVWPRFEERQQQVGVVAGVPKVHSEGSLCPDVGISRGLPLCRAFAQGCGHSHREQRGPAGAIEPKGDVHQEAGIRGSRSISPQATGAHPYGQEQVGHSPTGQGQERTQDDAIDQEKSEDRSDQGRGSNEHPRGPIISQAWQSSDSRSTGAGDGSGLRRLGAGAASTQLLREKTPEIDDDALLSQETDESVGTYTHKLTKEDRSKICAVLKGVQEELDECFASIPTHKCDLLEVCCGKDSGLTQVVLENGGKAFRVGYHNDMNLVSDHGLQRAKEFARIVKPKWMWISPTCGPTSPIQNLNQKSEQQIKNLQTKVRKSKKLTKACVELAKEQVERGGECVWEWPWVNGGWDFRVVKEFIKWLVDKGLFHRVRLDGCQVDARTHDTHELMLKPWKIITTSEHMAQCLDLRCTHDHDHAPCMGHDRAHKSELYPRKMCERVSRVVLDYLHHSPHELETMFVSDGNQDEFIGMTAEEKGIPPLDASELKKMQEVVRKLHVRSGHPSNRALMNTLRARGADPRIVELAQNHQCDDCKEIALPVPHRHVTLHQCTTLWHTLQIDIAQLPVANEVVHFLVMCDEASHFCNVAELFRHHKQESRNATSQEVIKALEQVWFQNHGPPNVVRCDPEGCFRGIALSDYLSARGVELLPCAGEDHGQIGTVERLINKIKTDARTLLRSIDVDPYIGILHVVGAHNMLDRIGGYAPIQWTYGRFPEADGR